MPLCFSYSTLRLFTALTMSCRGSRNRFLIWVAFIRPKSPKLSKDQKLSCPIIECPYAEKPFKTVDDMLEHVYTCDHLTKGYLKGRYNCSECGREERISRCHKSGCNNKSSCKDRIVNSTKQFRQLVGSLRKRSIDSIDLHSELPYPELHSEHIPAAELQDTQGWQPPELSVNNPEKPHMNAHELVGSQPQWMAPRPAERSHTYPLASNQHISSHHFPQYQTLSRSPPPSYAHPDVQNWADHTPSVGSHFYMDSSSQRKRLMQNMNGPELYGAAIYPDPRLSPLTSPSSEVGYFYPPSPIESPTGSSQRGMMQSPTNISSITSLSDTYFSNVSSSDVVGYGQEYGTSQFQNDSHELFSPREPPPTPAEPAFAGNYGKLGDQNATYNQNMGIPQDYKFSSLGQVGQQFQHPLNSPIAPKQSSSPILEEQAQSPSTIYYELPSSPPKQLQCGCGYVPRGKDANKSSNLKRHQSACQSDRRQTPYNLGRRNPKLKRPHKCSYSNCRRSYTRSDNLKVHQRNKNHTPVAELMCDFTYGVAIDANNQHSPQSPPLGAMQQRFLDGNAWDEFNPQHQ
ncbi:hypothetical protein BGZ60DRAFT_394712 [Tricladium varicosporioides]|nr:hypothetical protein BGZ60DRAFT_394712 [Hymenoscyphus varicosporioides]